MSDAALATPAFPRPVPARPRRNRLNPLEALERGFALFRSTFGREGWRYYSGTAPVVLCFIPIWVANGQIRISNAVLLMEAALLAGAFLLRVSMVGSYMQHIRERAYNTPKSKPAGASAQAAAVGRLLAWKIMLSGGALATLPTVAGASWFYAASQFASLEAQEDTIERHSFTGCLALSSQWFGGGVLLFLMLVPLWMAVWLNGLILAMVVPQLLHSIFGVSTVLSTQMGLYSLVQSSAFWLSLSAGAWLALDPIVKCTFVIVYQHLRSRREGDDLRALVGSLPREQQKKARKIASNASAGRVVTGALLGLAAILVGISMTAAASAQQIPPPQGTTAAGNTASEARVQRLRQALDQESRRTIYRWHDAENPSAPTAPTWFEKMLPKIGSGMYRAWHALWNFLRKLWPGGSNLSLGKGGGGWKLMDIRLWLALVAILTLAAGGVLMWLRQRRQTALLSLSVAVAPIPDMSDAAAASERSEDEWFALAGQLEDEGELRFALRAAYFGLLAGLERREWLTIRRDRTNREYLNEFTRRWRRRPQAAAEARPEIPDKLRGSLRQFDCVWYGSHQMTADAITAYRHNQREFLNHV